MAGEKQGSKPGNLNYRTRPTRTTRRTPTSHGHVKWLFPFLVSSQPFALDFVVIAPLSILFPVNPPKPNVINSTCGVAIAPWCHKHFQAIFLIAVTEVIVILCSGLQAIVFIALLGHRVLSLRFLYLAWSENFSTWSTQKPISLYMVYSASTSERYLQSTFWRLLSFDSYLDPDTYSKCPSIL